MLKSESKQDKNLQNCIKRIVKKKKRLIKKTK